MTAAPHQIRNRFTESDGSPIVNASILSANFDRLGAVPPSAGRARVVLAASRRRVRTELKVGAQPPAAPT